PLLLTRCLPDRFRGASERGQEVEQSLCFQCGGCSRTRTCGPLIKSQIRTQIVPDSIGVLVVHRGARAYKWCTGGARKSLPLRRKANAYGGSSFTPNTMKSLDIPLHEGAVCPSAIGGSLRDARHHHQRQHCCPPARGHADRR